MKIRCELFVRYLYINVYYPYHVTAMSLIYYIICIINSLDLIYRQLLKKTKIPGITLCPLLLCQLYKYIYGELFV